MTVMSMKVKAMPSAMRLCEWVALEEKLFEAEGLAIEIPWDVLHGTMSKWQAEYRSRPQDKPFTTQGNDAGIMSACSWGSVCNAASGMGKFVPDMHGVSPWGIYVRAESEIRGPQDLRDVPIGVALRAGSHFSVPFHLEKYLSLENIKPVHVGGHGGRLTALLDKEVEAASLMPPQTYMAEELGLRRVVGGQFKTLWWVDEHVTGEAIRRYFRALKRAEAMMARDLGRYLPLWKYSIPPEDQNRAWNFAAFGPGERFVDEPISREEYDELIAQTDRWNLGDVLKERGFENLIARAAA